LIPDSIGLPVVVCKQTMTIEELFCCNSGARICSLSSWLLQVCSPLARDLAVAGPGETLQTRAYGLKTLSGV